MKKFWFALLLSNILSCVAVAGNYELEGTSPDGYTITYSTEPPESVSYYKKASNGEPKDFVSFENEGCILEIPSTTGISAKSTLICPPTGKSPLAGTKYVRTKRVGFGKDCQTSVVYDIYTCVSGCKGKKRTPKKLKLEGDCC